MRLIPTSILHFKHLPFLLSLSFISNYSTPATRIFPKSNPKKPISAVPKLGNYVVYCNSQISEKGRSGNLEAAESIFHRMPFKTVVSWTALLTAYADNGELSKARKVFEEMPKRNTASWNAMITAYVRNLRMKEAFHLFSVMPEKNCVSYAVMITGYTNARMLGEAHKLYFQMPVIGRDPIASNALIHGYLKTCELQQAVWIFEGMTKRDVVSWSSILDGYCKQGRISDARDIFNRMPEPNVVSWTTMVCGYLKSGMWEEGFELFSRMRTEDSVRINSITLTVTLDACANTGRIREGIQIHGLVQQMGFECDPFLSNSVVNMYCRVGWVDAARKTFDLMGKKDLVSWNSIITGYVLNNGVEKAFELFNRMPRRDVVSWTAMVVGFSNSGRMEESISLFKVMPIKDVVAWTAVVSGLVGNGQYGQAFRWFVQMLREDIKPTSVTISSILSASARMAVLHQGVQIHCRVVRTGLDFDRSVQNSLISMYAKCGNVSEAYQIFSKIGEPNLVSLNSMITGFAQHGFGEQALDIFRRLQISGTVPNEITFLGVLSACVHVGLVEKGWDYFKSMKPLYQIEPKPDHYVCMVDLLGRAGKLKEATDLICSMPFKPHSAVWGALLNACRTHLDLDLAKFAAQRLFELEPASGTAYAILSNMYSAVGLKKEEEELRLTKKSKGLKKNPGCSWIMVGTL